MMGIRFRTEIERPEATGTPLTLGGGPVVLLGSCFADEMGKRLIDRGYEVCCNPFGPLFNPESLRLAVERISLGESFRETDLQHPSHCGAHVWEASADVTAGVERPIERLNAILGAAHEALLHAQRVFVTLGTTRAFVNRHTGRVVANCHKYPARAFDEITLGLGEVEASLRSIREHISAPLTATVSPVLHPGPGGLVSAFLSKAVLRTAISTTGLEYFPAYEALACDLRDYRFYASDMRHPSEVGADYIFELFESTYLASSEAEQRRQNLSAARQKRHRPHIKQNGYDIINRDFNQGVLSGSER